MDEMKAIALELLGKYEGSMTGAIVGSPIPQSHKTEAREALKNEVAAYRERIERRADVDAAAKRGFSGC